MQFEVIRDAQEVDRARAAARDKDQRRLTELLAESGEPGFGCELHAGSDTILEFKYSSVPAKAKLLAIMRDTGADPAARGSACKILAELGEPEAHRFMVEGLGGEDEALQIALLDSMTLEWDRPSWLSRGADPHILAGLHAEDDELYELAEAISNRFGVPGRLDSFRATLNRAAANPSTYEAELFYLLEEPDASLMDRLDELVAGKPLPMPLRERLIELGREADHDVAMRAKRVLQSCAETHTCHECRRGRIEATTDCDVSWLKELLNSDSVEHVRWSILENLARIQGIEAVPLLREELRGIPRDKPTGLFVLLMKYIARSAVGSADAPLTEEIAAYDLRHYWPEGSRGEAAYYAARAILQIGAPGAAELARQYLPLCELYFRHDLRLELEGYDGMRLADLLAESGTITERLSVDAIRDVLENRMDEPFRATKALHSLLWETGVFDDFYVIPERDPIELARLMRRLAERSQGRFVPEGVLEQTDDETGIHTVQFISEDVLYRICQDKKPDGSSVQTMIRLINAALENNGVPERFNRMRLFEQDVQDRANDEEDGEDDEHYELVFARPDAFKAMLDTLGLPFNHDLTSCGPD